MYQNFKSFLRQSRYKFIDKGRGYLSKKYAEKFFCHFFYFERERDGERQKGGGRGGTEGGGERERTDVHNAYLPHTLRIACDHDRSVLCIWLVDALLNLTAGPRLLLHMVDIGAATAYHCANRRLRYVQETGHVTSNGRLRRDRGHR